MRVAGLQLDTVWEDREANYRRVEAFARIAKEKGADLLVLPEMFSTGFSMNLGVTKEAHDGPTTGFIKSLARNFKMAVMGGLVLEGHGGLGRNCARIVDSDGNEVGTYAKCHLFSYADEHLYHEPGAQPMVFALAGVKVAPFVCYDLRFPEIFRLVSPRVHLIVVIASWPAPRQLHWDTLLPARAVENQCFVVGINRVGEGGGLRYTGGSAVYNPLGERIAFGGDQEALVIAEVDPEEVEKVRTEMPFLNDRRSWPLNYERRENDEPV